jgi:hypothetical protein
MNYIFKETCEPSSEVRCSIYSCGYRNSRGKYKRATASVNYKVTFILNEEFINSIENRIDRMKAMANVKTPTLTL